MGARFHLQWRSPSHAIHGGRKAAAEEAPFRPSGTLLHQFRQKYSKKKKKCASELPIPGGQRIRFASLVPTVIGTSALRRKRFNSVMTPVLTPEDKQKKSETKGRFQKWRRKTQKYQHLVDTQRSRMPRRSRSLYQLSELL